MNNSNKFVLSGAQSHELEMAVDRCGGDSTDIHWLHHGENFKQVMKLARGKAKLAMLDENKGESIVHIDPIVRVDRSVRPVYPDFLDQDYINKPEFIELEKMGPAQFDASKLRFWHHPKQKKGMVCGQVIHDYLKQKQMLSSCLGFTDLLAIQSKGIEFFRKHFSGKFVFGWRSVVPGRDGFLYVPYLFEYGDKVVLRWYWLGFDWRAGGPALRFSVSDLQSK